MLEGQTATKQKSDQIVAPQVTDLAPLLGQLAPAVDTVARNIGAKIGARSRTRRFRIARWCDLDQRAGLRISGAESGEFEGCLLWEDD